MVIPIEAVSKEDFERMEKGLPPLPKKKIVRPEPELPEIPNRIEFDKIPVDKVKRIVKVSQPERLRNKEGNIFIAYRIELEMGDGSLLDGYAFEGDAIRIRKLPWIRENSDARVIDIIR